MSRTVYLFSWYGRDSPDDDGGAGGFEWRTSKDGAKRDLESTRRNLTGCHVAFYGVVEVEVPDSLTVDETTEWIDARPDLWDHADPDAQEATA